MYLTVEEEG